MARVRRLPSILFAALATALVACGTDDRSATRDGEPEILDLTDTGSAGDVWTPDIALPDTRRDTASGDDPRADAPPDEDIDRGDTGTDDVDVAPEDAGGDTNEPDAVDLDARESDAPAPECADTSCPAPSFCVVVEGEPTCACPSGYLGPDSRGRCLDIDECGGEPTPCGPDARCDNSPGSFVCTCLPGFRDEGGTCVEVDECDVPHDRCGANEVCIDEVNGWTCGCAEGWVRRDGLCVDVDECAEDPDLCGDGARCRNLDGDWTCDCLEGFERGDNGSCVDIDECSAGTDACADAARCDNRPGGYDCTCLPGWTGNGRQCSDIDECRAGLDACSPFASCTNREGGYDCACEPGWRGNGRQCADIDECTETPGLCPAGRPCLNFDGGYRCGCADGYTLEGDRCVDLDECASGVDECAPEATCDNTVGSYTCRCIAGFIGDGRQCASAGRTTSWTTGRVDVPIADNAFTTGARSGLACVPIDVPRTSRSVLERVRVRTTLRHTWTGDLTMILYAPDGSGVVLAQRPKDGDPGANLAETHPISFSDGAQLLADAMTGGFSGTGNTNTVCRDNNRCAFRPSRGDRTVLLPSGTWRAALGDLAGQTTPHGRWEFCVGDGASQDLGAIVRFELELDTTCAVENGASVCACPGGAAPGVDDLCPPTGPCAVPGICGANETCREASNPAGYECSCSPGFRASSAGCVPSAVSFQIDRTALARAIPDSTWDGALTTAACVPVVAPVRPQRVLTGVRARVGLDHPSIDDVTLLLYDPTGQATVLVERQDVGISATARSGNYAASHPILFTSGVQNAADQLSAGLTSTSAVACRDNGVCQVNAQGVLEGRVSPLPPRVTMPSLASLAGQILDGSWTLCAVDSSPSGAGTLQSVTLFFDAECPGGPCDCPFGTTLGLDGICR